MKDVIIGAAVLLVVAAELGASPAPVRAPETPMLPKPVRVLFVGDLMLDRNVAVAAHDLGQESLIATSTRDLFASADLRVGNLEGTITTNASIAQRNSKILRFTFDPKLAEYVLTTLHFNAVSLANNHTLDFGKFGYDDTRFNLGQWGVPSFGQPFNESNPSTTLQTKDGSFCLVGYNATFDASSTPVLAEVVRLHANNCWKIVVFAHWGQEYQTHSNQAQQQDAHAFIDAGADLVIGSHPHVVEEVETYKGKAIFYSLGNFLFDQNFSWETTHSLAVRVDFGEQNTSFVLVPLTIEDQQVSVAQGEHRQKILTAAGIADFTLP